MPKQKKTLLLRTEKWRAFLPNATISYYLLGSFKPKSTNKILMIESLENYFGEKKSTEKVFNRIPKYSGKSIFFMVRKAPVFYKPRITGGI